MRGAAGGVPWWSVGRFQADVSCSSGIVNVSGDRQTTMVSPWQQPRRYCCIEAPPRDQ